MTRRKQKESWDDLVEDEHIGEGEELDGVESAEIEQFPPEKTQARAVIPSPDEMADIDEEWEELESDAWSDSAQTEINQGKGKRLPLSQRLPEREKPRIDYSAQDIIVTEGDFIEIDFEEGPNDAIFRGKIIEMYSDRNVPDVGEIVRGTPQDPALKIEIYTKNGDEWKPTGKFIGMKMSRLQRGAES